MSQAANLEFSLTDNTKSITGFSSGIYFVEGITKRGKINNPDQIITSWPMFKKYFGGEISASNFPSLMKLALERGCQLRVNRVAHYTDVSSAATLTAVKPEIYPVKIMTFGGALITANSFTCKVNGVSMTPVVFATTSDAQMAAIAAALKLMDGIQDAVVKTVGAGTDNDRVIVITLDGATETTITDAAVTLGATQTTVTITESVGVCNVEGEVLFTVACKHYGADYNNLTLEISDASNGSALYFNMTLTHAIDSELNETYENLYIDKWGAVSESTFLNAAKASSETMDYGYVVLTALTGTHRPKNTIYYFAGGSDGGSIVATDYTGDSAGKTGFHAFDEFDDSMVLCCPEISDSTVHIAGEAYVKNREDLLYYGHIALTNTTADQIIAARVAIGTDSKWAFWTSGGEKRLDTRINDITNFPETAQVLGCIAYTHTNFGAWRSFAGPNQGVFSGSKGVVNNFGTKGLFADLDNILKRQVNMAISRNGKQMLWGQWTSQLGSSDTSFASIMFLYLYLKKSLTPTFESFLEEPLDLPLLSTIFYTLKPFMDDLAKPSKRALSGWTWKGDQDAKSIADFQINNPTDFGQGKYKAVLELQTIKPLVNFSVEIVLTPAGVNFNLQ